MRARLKARFATVMAAVAIAVIGLSAGPADASVGGDVINQLNSSYTVKVAFFSEGSEGCYTWNYDMLNCTINRRLIMAPVVVVKECEVDLRQRLMEGRVPLPAVGSVVHARNGPSTEPAAPDLRSSPAATPSESRRPM